MTHTLSTQAVGAIMMALQKGILEQSDRDWETHFSSKNCLDLKFYF